MCGIAGYLGPHRIPPERVEACLRAMRRRGPDARGAYEHHPAPDRHVYLLHTRLSIIDLDRRADQPFRAGPHVLVYNGELYNYLEIRRELASAGCVFTTESDTEVLLRAVAEQGLDALERCEGMWAFALYRETDRSLVLCRDRFGEKPLYLYREDGGLYFASEVKFITALRGRAPAVHFNHIYRYLVNGYKSLYKTGETFFRGVEELPPGHTLTVDAANDETHGRYWRPDFAPDDSMTRADAVEGVRAALTDSVRLRLRADVPLAFCMSGGVDSNALISIARRRLGFDVHGFTIVNDDSRYDEREEVECAVRELGIRHTAVPLTTRDFLDNLVTLVRQHDAPVYTISYYVHWLLMAAVADAGYRISISGTGADELFTGYYDHHNLWLYEVRDTPAFPAALAAWQEHIAPIVRNPYLKNPRLYFDDPGCRDHIYLDNDGFATCLRGAWREAFAEQTYCPSLLRNRMLNELFHESVPVILHEDDLNAMYYSIENRSPFLDRRLFEFCCRIPTQHLMRDGYAKAILRDAMAGIVPDRVLWTHRKVGFNAPILGLLDVRAPDVRARVLDGSAIFEHVRRDRIEALMARDALPNSDSKFLFYFVCAKTFVDEYAGP